MITKETLNIYQFKISTYTCMHACMHAHTHLLFYMQLMFFIGYMGII